MENFIFCVVRVLLEHHSPNKTCKYRLGFFFIICAYSFIFCWETGHYTTSTPYFEILVVFIDLSSKIFRCLKTRKATRMQSSLYQISCFVLFVTNKASTKTWQSSRGSHSQMLFKIGVLKNFSNFTGKHLCWSLFLKPPALLK